MTTLQKYRTRSLARRALGSAAVAASVAVMAGGLTACSDEGTSVTATTTSITATSSDASSSASSDSSPSTSSETGGDAGDTASEADVEQTAKSTLAEKAGVSFDDVNCPTDLRKEVGESMRCTATKGGETYPIKVTVKSVEGSKVNLTFEVLVKQADVEKSANDALSKELGAPLDKVSCPDDLAGEVGETMTCTATYKGQERPLHVTVKSVEGTTVRMSFDVPPDGASSS